jgi:monofunctional biosynthetic peptidoglycan transglycosylase
MQRDASSRPDPEPATVSRRRSPAARLGRAIAAVVAGLAAVSILAVLPFRWLPVPVTAFMLQDRLGALLSARKDYRFEHDWVPWEEISPHAAVAVIAAEDQKFAVHSGFDLESIDQALAEARSGRRLRGASTISQQVAKNLFLWPGQSWFRKGLEAWLTVLIEAFWSKRRILEVYLNSAEFGRGVWGVEAASRRFFGRPARRLDPGEAALLAAVLPNPERFRADAPSAYLRRRQAWIESQMAALGGPACLDALDPAAPPPR